MQQPLIHQITCISRITRITSRGFLPQHQEPAATNSTTAPFLPQHQEPAATNSTTAPSLLQHQEPAATGHTRHPATSKSTNTYQFTTT